MKSPHNALSDLPIVEAGGYHLGDVDARASEPGVVRPRTRDAQHVPAVPPPRRPTITPKPFAPALAPRRSDGHSGIVAFFVMALIAGGGYAGWKYWWLPNHPEQAAASAPAATAPASAATPDTAKRSGTTLATGHQPPAAAVASDSPLVAFDRNADSVTTLTDIYKARVQANQTGCPGLGLALVAVEDAWTRYNVVKRKAGSIGGDGTRYLRDQQLYATVDTVERDFDRSGCTRP